MKMIKNIALALVTVAFLGGCQKQMNLSPKYGLNADAVYADAANYENVLAKLYAGLAISGNQGPAGMPDIGGIDEGFSQYVRVLWNLQELPTDEAICGWNDPGIPELNTTTWNDNSSFVSAMYYRIYYQIALANEFIRYCNPEWTDLQSFTDAELASIASMKAEARFLRALSYYHAMDLFGNVPFVDEGDRAGVFYPEQITRSDLYDYVVSELVAIEMDLPGIGNAVYGRADRGALLALRSKVYLNAEVYSGSAAYDLAMADAEAIITSGAYSLEPVYAHNFLADNHTSNEFIFSVAFDGQHTQTWGGTTFLVHSHVGGSMDPDDFGINGGWQGNRATLNWLALFDGTTNDSRLITHTGGRTDTIHDIGDFTQGIAVTKWKNVDRDTVAGSDPNNFPDTDFPMFRLADFYLVYAECALRLQTNSTQALTYYNTVRQRAFGDNSGDATSITLQDIIDERGRELYTEGKRRSDLIRFGMFSGSNYLWQWKGEALMGTSTDAFYDLYPIPAADLNANSNLVQNPGY